MPTPDGLEFAAATLSPTEVDHLLNLPAGDSVRLAKMHLLPCYRMKNGDVYFPAGILDLLISSNNDRLASSGSKQRLSRAEMGEMPILLKPHEYDEFHGFPDGEARSLASIGKLAAIRIADHTRPGPIFRIPLPESTPMFPTRLGIELVTRAVKAQLMSEERAKVLAEEREKLAR